MKREAPKVYRRFTRAMRAQVPMRDQSLIISAADFAEEQFHGIGAENVLKILDDPDLEGIGFEGTPQTCDGSKLSAGDIKLMGWAFRHRFVELVVAHRAVRHPAGTA
jgi:hypothetical protein